MSPAAAEVVRRAEKALFGAPLVTNTVRGVLVEAMIAQALDPDWRWCSADYASWDFENGDLRLEVKQSAAMQSWNRSSGRASACSFDIAHRTQAWENETWTKGRRRAAHLYVFAHHPVTDESADHREPGQWKFHVVPTSMLPDTARITISKVQRLSPAYAIGDLAMAVAKTTSTDA